MGATKKKKKILIHTLEFTGPERHRQFEIKLPANVKKISGIIITATPTDLVG